jgi:hypothetical protein
LLILIVTIPKNYMFLSMWLYSPQSVLNLFYICLVRVVRVVSIKQPSPKLITFFC